MKRKPSAWRGTDKKPTIRGAPPEAAHKPLECLRAYVALPIPLDEEVHLWV
jgi:hypothetical protein